MVVLNNEPQYYAKEKTDTIGDASIPYGTKKETFIEVTIGYDDIHAIIQEIETDYGIFKVDLLPYFKENRQLLQDIIMEVEQVISDEF